jgi:hypothetical protein
MAEIIPGINNRSIPRLFNLKYKRRKTVFNQCMHNELLASKNSDRKETFKQSVEKCKGEKHA